MAAETRFLPRLRTMQVIVFAMLAGQVVFVAIVYFVRANNSAADPARAPIFSWLALAFFAFQVPLSIVLPTALENATIRRIATGTWKPPADAAPESFATDEDKLLAVRLTSVIVGMALLEGTGLFGAVAYLLDGQLVPLMVVAAVLILMVVRFPTEVSVRAWLERQAQRLAELRQG
jgi:hypothetical protein